jgi:hypothetical protein
LPKYVNIASDPDKAIGREKTMANDDAATLERFRVHELIHRYVDTLNHRDWAGYKDCWIEDAIFEMTVEADNTPARGKLTTAERPNNIRLTGVTAIVGMVGNYEKIAWLFQMPHGIVVELENATTARIRHTLHAYSEIFTMLGICYDRAVKGKDGMWRLAHRDFRPSYYLHEKAPGLCVRNLPHADYRALPKA